MKVRASVPMNLVWMRQHSPQCDCSVRLRLVAASDAAEKPRRNLGK
jgi:hypothetical protein